METSKLDQCNSYPQWRYVMVDIQRLRFDVATLNSMCIILYNIIYGIVVLIKIVILKLEYAPLNVNDIAKIMTIHW